jgi:hypothetical protein
MKTYWARIQHEGTGRVYIVPVLASTLQRAAEKARDWPYMAEGYILLGVSS